MGNVQVEKEFYKNKEEFIMKKIFVLALVFVFVLSGAVMAQTYSETGDVFGDDDFLSQGDSNTLWETYYGDLDDDGGGDDYDKHVGDDGEIIFNDTNTNANDTTTYINLPFDNTLASGLQASCCC